MSRVLFRVRQNNIRRKEKVNVRASSAVTFQDTAQITRRKVNVCLWLISRRSLEYTRRGLQSTWSNYSSRSARSWLVSCPVALWLCTKHQFDVTSVRRSLCCRPKSSYLLFCLVVTMHLVMHTNSSASFALSFWFWTKNINAIVVMIQTLFCIRSDRFIDSWQFLSQKEQTSLAYDDDEKVKVRRKGVC